MEIVVLFLDADAECIEEGKKHAVIDFIPDYALRPLKKKAKFLFYSEESNPKKQNLLVFTNSYHLDNHGQIHDEICNFGLLGEGPHFPRPDGAGNCFLNLNADEFRVVGWESLYLRLDTPEKLKPFIKKALDSIIK